MTNIKYFRAKSGMSLKELSDRVGVSLQSVVDSESHMSIKMAYKYADIFNVSVFEILGEDLFRIVPESDVEKEIVKDML